MLSYLNKTITTNISSDFKISDSEITLNVPTNLHYPCNKINAD